MRGLLREPLLHFGVGGAALFLLYQTVAPPAPGPSSRIVVSAERVAMLASSFERTWMRPASEAELEGLVDDYVTEEILYREALALGLDRDDLIVRRRMRQKMEFLNEGLVEAEPSEDDLRAYLEANPQQFLLPARVSFAQVFVDPRASSRAKERAEGLLARLRAGGAPDALGDPTLLPRELTEATPAEVAGTFGDAFAESLAQAPEGAWSGPIASSFGLHVVRVGARTPARLPALEEVREATEREWEAEQRKEARERFYAALRERHDVEVQWPPTAPPPPRRAPAGTAP